MKPSGIFSIGCGLLFSLAGCASDEDPMAGGGAGTPGEAGHDAGGASTGGAHSGGVGGSTQGGGAPSDAGHSSSDEGGSAGASGGSPVPLPNFELRTPVEHSITCSSYPAGFPEDPQPFTDKDYVCTFERDGVEAVLYLQTTPVDCQVIMSPIPTYETTGAWVAIDGQITDLAQVVYDAGGNHRNDWFTFEYGGARYKYYHSSFGFGWRACHPMDCMQVLADDGQTVNEDGCTPARTLPVICVEVGPDGSVPPLADTFARCLGDESAP